MSDPNFPAIVSQEQATAFGAAMEAALYPEFGVESIDESMTRILENVLTQFESLRRDIEVAKQKDIDDVRDYGNTFAAALLVGFEGTVAYDNLLDIINHMKNGIAYRRVTSV